MTCDNILFKSFFCVAFLFATLSVFASEDHIQAAPSDFVVVTTEKCGTHLLTTAIEKLLNKPVYHWFINYRSPEEVQQKLDYAKKNHLFLQMHLLPKQDLIDLLHKNNHKVIFLIRDPRDQMVSLVHYVESGWEYGPKVNGKRFGPLSFSDKLLEVITGKRYGASALKNITGRKLPWLKQSRDFVYVVRFENLVGVEGGGTRELQLMEMRNIAQFLGLNLSDEEIDHRSQHIFGKNGETATFRKGQIGEWKKSFKPKHVQAFKEVFGKELIEMGYAKNFNWFN